MPNRIPISCTIIAHNEADRIERCILAVRPIADEIVVIDSGSTDDTVAIAKRLGARVEFRAWTGYGQQKRFAEDTAKFDWVLNLDADEVVSAQLAAEISALMRSEPPLRAYRFKQTTVYPGHEKPRLWADYKNQVRLYDRRVVRFHDSLTHDTVDLKDQPCGQFQGEALHYSWRSLDHVARKLDGYTDLQALEIKKPRWKLLLRQPIEYPYLLFRFYVLRRHFTGGLYGMKVAHTFAAGRAKRISKFLAHGR
jgi:glycosyltransferase involved in cell wall biosynthesis